MTFDELSARIQPSGEFLNFSSSKKNPKNLASSTIYIYMCIYIELHVVGIIPVRVQSHQVIGIFLQIEISNKHHERITSVVELSGF